MFTGIVTQSLPIHRITGNEEGKTFELPCMVPDHTIGESILVDGVCSTIIAVEKGFFTVEYMPETLRLTTFGVRREGDTVNLERSMTLETLISGHVVSGHVDTTARLKSITDDGIAKTLEFEISIGAQYLIQKGSVTINGISLTVIAPTDTTFSVSIIPHTWQVTNLHEVKIGGSVNIEFDMLAKYIERQLVWHKEK